MKRENSDNPFLPSFNDQTGVEALRGLWNDTESMLHFGAWRQDIATGKLEWSDGMYELMGYEKKTIEKILNADFYVNHISENDKPGFEASFRSAITNNSVFEYTYTLNKKKQEDIVVYTKAKIVTDNTGKAVKLAGITRDITRERDYEQSLEDKVKELDRSNKELEEFAYIASHDLQEPLRKITSFSERLKEKLGNDIGADNLFYLTRMLAATDNMRSLIDNLLEFSRTSRYTQDLEKTDLNETLAETKADLELKIEETNTVIEAEDLPRLKAIPSQMRQLFSNLISNAIKFKIKDVPPLIVITSRTLSKEEKEAYRLRSSKAWRLISVKDNGIGFEQEYAFKIFQLFQRLHGKSEYPGSGIGLSICKKIVENHKGIIFAQSEPDAGAEFTIILPES
ncbi:MAG: ATP-binding protein [Flavitalea sp.]